MTQDGKAVGRSLGTGGRIQRPSRLLFFSNMQLYLACLKARGGPSFLGAGSRANTLYEEILAHCNDSMLYYEWARMKTPSKVLVPQRCPPESQVLFLSAALMSGLLLYLE